MDTEAKNAVRAAGKNAQYDERAKKLLAQKSILAWILKKTVDEFGEMKPEDIAALIEGEPVIGLVPSEPGMTNAAEERNGQKIIGFNTENSEIGEGLIRFDIVFYVRMKDGITKMIVNIESQKGLPENYYLLNRAVFYASRLISSQKERDFVKSNYDDIRRVYSIWICMNMKENSLNHIHLTEERILGHCNWQGGTDLMNIIMVGLSDEIPERGEEYELHRLLGALFSERLSLDEKLGIMEKEYDIPLADDIREDVDIMCNLSEGIWEKGRKAGEEAGRKAGEEESRREIIMSMYRNKFTIDQIAVATQKSMSEIRSIIESEQAISV